LQIWLNKKLFVFILFVYHLGFTALFYVYTLSNSSDANRYWFQNASALSTNWFDHLGIGTDLMLFLNYPFAVLLNLPFWFGFLLYGCIGFLGILQLFRLCKKWVGEEVQCMGINVLPFFFFLPNIHFWTAGITKEALCFLAIATILLKIFEERYRSLSLWVAFVFLFLLRPHVGMMLLFAVAVVLLWVKKWRPVVKFAITGGVLVVLTAGYLLFLQLSQIKSMHWGRLLRFNEGSILSFRDSGSYVPMLEYSYPMKLFSFYFRPLFVDAQNVFQWVLSVENLFLILLHLFVLYVFIRYWKRIQTDTLFKIVLVFALVAGLLYVQRYANLGIFARTKVMIQPFLVLGLLGCFTRLPSTGSGTRRVRNDET
tara:strand:- start:8822 stop:9928 length:1107 start_codon:yes stop_codon:yes gene_type:complete